MTNSNSDNKYWVLAGLAAVLAAALGVQAYFLFSLSHKVDSIAASRNDPTAISSPSTTSGQAPAVSQPLYSANGSFYWDPFGEMRRMQKRMDRMFQNAFHGSGTGTGGNLLSVQMGSPRVTLNDKGDEYIVKLRMPGIKQGSINVSVLGKRTLEIQAQTRNAWSKNNSTGGISTFQQRQVEGSFKRLLQLPQPVDPSSLKTAYNDQTLTIRLHKLVT